MDMWRRHIAFPPDRFDQRELPVRLFAGSQKGHQRTVVPDRTIQRLPSVAKSDGFCWFYVCCAGRFAGRTDFEVSVLLRHIGYAHELNSPSPVLFAYRGLDSSGKEKCGGELAVAGGILAP